MKLNTYWVWFIDSEAEVSHSSLELSKAYYFSVPRNQLQSVAAACKVLIEFSLLRLENPDEACAVSQVRVMDLFLALILRWACH